MTTAKTLNTIMVQEADMHIIIDFFNNFKIKVPQYLQDAMKPFLTKDVKPTLQDQESLRVALLQAMIDLRYKYKHPLFIDQIADPLIKEAEDLNDLLTINLELDKVLTDKKNTKDD